MTTVYVSIASAMMVAIVATAMVGAGIVALNVMRMGVDVVVIAIDVVAMRMMMAAMSSVVGMIDVGRIEEEVPSMIDVMNTEQPAAGIHVDGTQEVFAAEEGSVLDLIEDVAQVFVTVVEMVVVAVIGVIVASYDLVHIWVDRCDEVVVDFIAILILLWGKVELVGHAVA